MDCILRSVKLTDLDFDNIAEICKNIYGTSKGKIRSIVAGDALSHWLSRPLGILDALGEPGAWSSCDISGDLTKAAAITAVCFGAFTLQD
ncbi:MAG TPA: hypothetical protein VIC51_11920 [Psychromonas sp.]